jgi:hypothetical protein
MKRILIVATALASALSLAGCNTPGERAMGGALLGGAGGAAIGAAASGGRAGGTLAGAALGAATGAVVGAATTPQPAYYPPPPPPPPRCARWGRDYYGNRMCVAYYEY